MMITISCVYPDKLWTAIDSNADERSFSFSHRSDRHCLSCRDRMRGPEAEADGWSRWSNNLASLGALCEPPCELLGPHEPMQRRVGQVSSNAVPAHVPTLHLVRLDYRNGFGCSSLATAAACARADSFVAGVFLL